VEAGDTFAAVAKRYGTSPDVLSSANHDQLPEAGAFAAVPVAYPGDAKPVKVASRKPAAKKKTSAKTVAGTQTSRKPVAKSPAKSTAKATAKPSASATGKAVRSPAKRTSGA